MNKKYLGFASLVLLPIVLFTFFNTNPPAAHANEVDNQALDALVQSITKLGEAIKNSTNITDAERVSLFSQLVSLSNLILEIKKPSATGGNQNSQMATSSVEAIDYVAVQFDSETYEADITVNFTSGDTQEFTRTYENASSSRTYTGRVNTAKQLATNDIALVLGVSAKEIQPKVFITTRRPDRRLYTTTNSPEAEQLALNFGRHSIVTDVEVYPAEVTPSGDPDDPVVRTARILLRSDQEETMSTAIKQTSDGFFTDERYELQIRFYVTAGVDYTFDSFGDSDDRFIPVIDYTVPDLEREELYDALSSLFGQIPFAEQIDSFEDKILTFLFDNRTFYQIRPGAQVFAQNRQCYNAADTRIMSEFVSSFVNDAVVQNVVPPEDILFVAPLYFEDDSSADNNCWGNYRVF